MELFREFPEQLHLVVIGHRQSFIIANGERLKLKSFWLEYTNHIPMFDSNFYQVDHGLSSVRMEFEDGYVYVGWHRLHLTMQTPMYAFRKALKELMELLYCQSGLKRLGYVILDGLAVFLRRLRA